MFDVWLGNGHTINTPTLITRKQWLQLSQITTSFITDFTLITKRLLLLLFCVVTGIVSIFGQSSSSLNLIKYDSKYCSPPFCSHHPTFRIFSNSLENYIFLCKPNTRNHIVSRNQGIPFPPDVLQGIQKKLKPRLYLLEK